MKRTSNARTLGLVLGGGGMKGLAHVGVLSVLERKGLEPDAVSGCSIGALVGAFVASGFTSTHIIQILKSKSLFSLVSIRFDGEGLINMDDLRAFLIQHLGSPNLEDLPIPLVVSCTDLETGEEVKLDRGPLIESVLASAAVPGIFAPIKLGDRMLVDGGLRNNIPVDALMDREMDHIVAVRLYDQRTSWVLQDEMDRPATFEELKGRQTWRRWTIRQFLKRRPAALFISQRAVDLMVMQLESIRLKQYPPDLLISPEVTDIGIFDFHEAVDPLIKRGKEAALDQEAELDELVQLLNKTDKNQ